MKDRNMKLLFRKLIMTLILLSLAVVIFGQDKNVFTDVDGNKYNIIKIGNQYWLAENFKAVHAPDGSSVSGIYVYDDDQKNADKYGRLYTFEAADKVCPKGWHIPSDKEWMDLEMELGMPESETSGSGERGSDQGKKLKSGGSSRFNAVLCGYKSHWNGKYDYEGVMTIFWTTDINVDEAHRMLRILANNSHKVDRSGAQKVNAFSLRLIKD